MAQRALDGGRLADLFLVQLAGIQQPERVRVAQARDRHHERLALLEREPPRMRLGGVRVGLDRLRLLPGRVARESLAGCTGIGEVGNPLASSGEAGHALPFHRCPHGAADRLLRPHALIRARGGHASILPPCPCPHATSYGRERWARCPAHERAPPHPADRTVHVLGRPARADPRAGTRASRRSSGVDSEDPTRELNRTEFVRVSNQHALIRRIVKAAEIDTVIDTRLVVDSGVTSPRLAARERRDGHAEHPRCMLGPGLPRTEAGVQELRALLRHRHRRTRGSSPRRCAAAMRRRRR